MEARASLQSSALGPGAVMGWSGEASGLGSGTPGFFFFFLSPICLFRFRSDKCLLSKVFLCSFFLPLQLLGDSGRGGVSMATASAPRLRQRLQSS